MTRERVLRTLLVVRNHLCLCFKMLLHQKGRKKEEKAFKKCAKYNKKGYTSFQVLFLNDGRHLNTGLLLKTSGGYPEGGQLQ